MKIRKGLLLLIAATLAGSNCFADPLYESGFFVIPVNNVQQTTHTTEISELRKKFEDNPDNFNLSLKIAELLYKDGDQDNSMEQIGFNIAGAKDSPEKLDAFKAIILKRIEADPNSDFNYLVLGKIYKIQKDDDLIINQYKKVLEVNPNNQLAQIELAKNYQKDGNYKDAIEIYDNILKKYPYTKGIRPFRADCYYALGEKEKAEGEYRNGLVMEPEISNSATGLYMCLKDKRSVSSILKEIYPIYKTKPITAQDYMDFVSNFKYNAKDKNQIIRIYKEILKLDPQNTIAYDELTNYYTESKDYASLKKLLYKCMTPIKDKSTGKIVNINYPAINIATKAAILSPDPLVDAHKLIKLNHKNEAIPFLNRVDEGTPQICLLKAKTFSDIGDPVNSIFWYKKLLEKSQKSPELLCTISNEYKKINDYDNAKDYIQQALILSPKNKNYFELEKNIILAQNKQLTETAYKALDENNDELLTATINKLFENPYLEADSYVVKAASDQKLGDSASTLKDFLKAYELGNRDTFVLYSLAEKYATTDPQLAIKYYNECVLASKDPNEQFAKAAASKLKELNNVVPVNLINK